MERKKLLVLLVALLILSVSVGSLTVVSLKEKSIFSFSLNSSYFHPEINASYIGQDNYSQNFSYGYKPITNSLLTNYTVQNINYSFGKYTLLMTPTLLPVPVGIINLYNFSSKNLTSVQNPIGFVQPYVGITMVNVTDGYPGSLGFLPIQGKVISPNGSSYIFDLRGLTPKLSETILGEPINIGPSYFIGFNDQKVSNYSMPLTVGNYTLQLTIKLFHLLPIGYINLGTLTFTEPFYNFYEK